MYMTQLIALYGTINQIWLFKNIADMCNLAHFSRQKQSKVR